MFDVNDDAKGGFRASSLLIMGSNETPLLGKPVLPTSSCFLVRLTGGRFFVPA